MRTLPAGWPDPSEPSQVTPTVYLHVIGSSWPPASVQGDESLPDGWSRVGSWEIQADLDAPLLPGQINSSTQFSVANGSCTIPQPETGTFAPWSAGTQRIPDSGTCELVASFDGYAGTTAFVLGRFILDPISGKASEPYLTIQLVQDLMKLRRDHTLPTQNSFDSYGGFGGTPFSPTRIVEYAATAAGLAISSSADFSATIDSVYFPRRTDQLSAVQQVVAANLGAMYLTADGLTLKVKGPDYLLGAGTIDATVQVLDSFDDLAWSQDPGAAIDRIEVSYLPPDYDDGAFGPSPLYNAAVIWTAPRGAKLSPGASVTYHFDPKSAVMVVASSVIYGNTAKDGTGSSADLPVDVDNTSSGSWSVTITNNTGSTRYLMAPRGGAFPASDFSKGQRSFLVGTIDGSTESDSLRTLTWGVSADRATNTLTYALGRNIQSKADAQAILDRIIDRVTTPTYVFEDVGVVPDLRRELADLYRIDFPDAGLTTRALVSSIHTSGTAGGISQSITIAAMPLRISDFNTAWTGKTIAEFNTRWAGKTIADFNAAPLST